MVVTRETMSSSAVSTELRILISATNLPFFRPYDGRFSDVSTIPASPHSCRRPRWEEHGGARECSPDRPEKNRAIGRDVIPAIVNEDVGFCAGTPLVPDDGALLFELFAHILQRSRRNKEKGSASGGWNFFVFLRRSGKPHIVMRHHIPESPFQEADRIPPHLVNFGVPNAPLEVRPG